MNRHDRRKARKRSRDATPDEIFPPGHPHSGVQPGIHDALNRMMNVLRDAFPGYGVTLFLNERGNPEGRLPRFNYASTEDREDMVAVLEAFIAKNRAEGPKIDRIAETPPTDTPQ